MVLQKYNDKERVYEMNGCWSVKEDNKKKGKKIMKEKLSCDIESVKEFNDEKKNVDSSYNEEYVFCFLNLVGM